MKRMNAQHNTPEVYENSFNNFLAITDMDRHYALAKYFKGGVYVDVGCYDSLMPILLAERYPKSEIWALDYAEKVIDFLASRFPRVHYKTHDCRTLPFADESVDYVVAGEFIEHLDKPGGFVDEAMRVLRPGGYLAVSTPLDEEKISMHVGGQYHIWSYSIDDIKGLLGTDDVDVLQESNTKTILAWRKK